MLFFVSDFSSRLIMTRNIESTNTSLKVADKYTGDRASTRKRGFFNIIYQTLVFFLQVKKHTDI